MSQETQTNHPILRKIPYGIILSALFGALTLAFGYGQITGQVEHLTDVAKGNRSAVQQLGAGQAQLREGQSNISKSFDRVVDRLDRVIERKAARLD